MSEDTDYFKRLSDKTAFMRRIKPDTYPKKFKSTASAEEPEPMTPIRAFMEQGEDEEYMKGEQEKINRKLAPPSIMGKRKRRKLMAIGG